MKNIQEKNKELELIKINNLIQSIAMVFYFYNT